MVDKVSTDNKSVRQYSDYFVVRFATKMRLHDKFTCNYF